MTSTRLDIGFAARKLSRYTSSPSKFHWHAIRRVLKYLKETQNYGLSYLRYPSIIKAYSTMAAEFVALAATSKEAQWLPNLSLEVSL